VKLFNEKNICIAEKEDESKEWRNSEGRSLGKESSGEAGIPFTREIGEE
jgi:hypothetical protein